MKRKSQIKLASAIAAAALLMFATGARAVSVADLQKRLGAGEKLTVIDVRGTFEYQQSHIPGAINIPASVCPLKHLPPMGKVIVYDDGLGLTQPDSAAAALAAKPGITVEILEGGYSAWESAHALTTRSGGLKKETLNYISYADLKAARPEEILLVDLRQPVTATNFAQGSSSTSQPVQALTDLNTEFPNLHRAPQSADVKSLAVAGGSGSGAPPLLVLIDNSDGKSEAMARSLKASGARRYIILAGGEKILARHGQAGLERSSPGNRLMKASTITGGTNK